MRIQPNHRSSAGEGQGSMYREREKENFVIRNSSHIFRSIDGSVEIDQE